MSHPHQSFDESVPPRLCVSLSTTTAASSLARIGDDDDVPTTTPEHCMGAIRIPTMEHVGYGFLLILGYLLEMGVQEPLPVVVVEEDDIDRESSNHPAIF